MGVKIKTVQPLGKLSAMVPRHGVVLYRLRPRGGMNKDEL